jgi:iduronate 2-sulfatase
MKTLGGLEGTSLLPLMKNPELPWKKAAFTQYPRSRKSHRHSGYGHFMGYAVRTDSHRYIEWREWKTRKIVTRELYNHRSDSQETVNIASRKEHKATITGLSKLLKAGWQSALPPGHARLPGNNLDGRRK